MNDSPPSLTYVLTAIEAAATVAFALSGLLAAARKRFDAVGVCVVAGLAAFGGVLRDIVCNEIPSAFHDHRPYAICAFAGGWVLIGMHALGAADWVGLVCAALVAALLRVVALLSDYTLPRWSSDDDQRN